MTQIPTVSPLADFPKYEDYPSGEEWTNNGLEPWWQDCTRYSIEWKNATNIYNQNIAKISSINTNVQELKNQTQTSATTATIQATIATQKAQTATQEASNISVKVALLDALTAIKFASFRIVDGDLLVTHADTITSPRLQDGDLIITY